MLSSTARMGFVYLLDSHCMCSVALTSCVMVAMCPQDHFLHGIPACDLTKSTSLKAVIEKRLDALMRSPGPHHCCIKSYNPPRQNSGEPEVRYRLFDTRLQC
jgi:hypothetical protein